MKKTSVEDMTKLTVFIFLDAQFDNQIKDAMGVSLPLIYLLNMARY